MINIQFKNYTIATQLPEHARGLAYVQRTVFPTLSDQEIITEKDYLNYLSIFPEGQLVIMDENGDIIGACTTMRCSYHPGFHSFLAITGNMSLSTHEKDGEWLYGVDLSILSKCQRQGLGGEIYRVRQDIARKLGCKGQLTVGMTNGYVGHRDELSIEEYCEKLKKGELKDPTVSAQMKNGFRWIEPFFEYLNDPKSGNAGISMYYPIDENLTLEPILT